MTGTVALIVAAGRGVRLAQGETALPKQYLPLAGRAVLAHAASAFAAHRAVDAVRVVIHPDDRALYDEATAGLDLMEPVTGGAERQDSVRLGLESLEDTAPDRVLIHDAARPNPESALISRTIDALDAHPGAVPALAVADSLKLGADGVVTGAVARDGLYRAQTPQAFRYADILDAHRAALAAGRSDYTDDAAIAEGAGLAVALVAGSEDNLKITEAADFERAARILASGAEYRTGQGLDVHAFADQPGPVRLCGVDVAHDRGLAGHSDADSGLHALTDALLGTIGAGDIGVHFPPSDAQWKDADSALFVARAAELVTQAGGRIVNVDITLICEAPKIGPYRDAMRDNVAAILGLTPDRVGIKATTTEKLGAIGRAEGIAAQALATVAMAPETS